MDESTIIANTSWFDPRIVVAILFGALGIAGSAGNLLFTLHLRRRLGVWEEYKDTVYDPILLALKEFEEVAAPHKISSDYPSATESATYFQHLGEAFNAVALVCSRNDHHPISRTSNLEKIAEAKYDNVWKIVGQCNGTTIQNCSLGQHAEPLKSALEAFVNSIRDELRARRLEMS